MQGYPVVDAKTMREVLGDLIGQVRYLTMAPADFAEGPALSDLLTKEEALAIFVNISSSAGGKRCPMPEKFVTTTTKRKIATIHPTTSSCLMPSSTVSPSFKTLGNLNGFPSFLDSLKNPLTRCYPSGLLLTLDPLQKIIIKKRKTLNFLRNFK